MSALGTNQYSRTKRLPLEPFLRALALARAEDNETGVLVSDSHRALIVRAKRAGGFTHQTADNLSILILHRHPSEIWGDSWFEGAADCVPKRQVLRERRAA